MLQMSVNMNCDCDWRRRNEMGDRQEETGKSERERVGGRECVVV